VVFTHPRFLVLAEDIADGLRPNHTPQTTFEDHVRKPLDHHVHEPPSREAVVLLRDVRLRSSAAAAGARTLSGDARGV